MKNTKQIMVFELRKRAFLTSVLVLTVLFTALTLLLVYLSLSAWSANKVTGAVDVLIALFIDGSLCGMICYWSVWRLQKHYKVKIIRNHK